MYKISVIKGDGIGPEMVNAALKVLDAVGFEAEYTELPAGISCFENTGEAIPDETIEQVRNSDACFFGSITSPVVRTPGYRSPIITLRQKLDLYANIRPVKTYFGDKSFDIIMVRENTEGLYSGLGGRFKDSAYTMRIITRSASERIVKHAFELARKEGRKKVTVVHKANVLRDTCGLFLEVAKEVAKDYPDIEMNAGIVDAVAMRLIREPEKFDVIVTTNLFGDILADLLAQLGGGLGLAPSGNIGIKSGLFEPIHGSAPEFTGTNTMNPIAQILSAKMMLEWLGETEKAQRIQKAVQQSIDEGKVTTGDLGGSSTTTEVADEIVRLVSD